MVWPSWLWVGTSLKPCLWLVNRLATWTGVRYFWKRQRSRRSFWVWVILINVVSLAGLGLLFCWLR